MTSLDEARESPLEVLLGCLDLDSWGADLFVGDPGPGEGRLFGGMVAAQSVIAAGRSVAPERQLHSLHAYFLRPGRHDEPIRFVVDRIRDGRSFSTIQSALSGIPSQSTHISSSEKPCASRLS
jgi:acyl-CoA thioesterase-2